MRATNLKVIPQPGEVGRESDPLGQIWLSIDDVVALGRGRRKVQMKIALGEWTSRTMKREGPNGRPKSELLLSSLPQELQRRWLANERLKLAPEQSIEPQLQSSADLKSEIRLNEALQRLSIKEREAFLTEARRRMEIVQRYAALPVKRIKKETYEKTNQRSDRDSGGGRGPSSKTESADSAGRAHALDVGDVHAILQPDTKSNGAAAQRSKQIVFTREVLLLCEEARCTNETILAYYRSRQHSLRKGTEPIIARAIAPRTLDDWSRQVQKDGLLTFLPAPAAVRRSDDKRRTHVSPAALQWIDQNLRSCPHARDLFQKLQKQACKHGWKIPSERWVYRRWKDLPAIVTTKGAKAYVDKLAPYVPRDYSDLEALQILCGDHSLRDVTVRLPDGTLVRPWCSAWQCMRTGLVWGWHLDLTPSSRTIGLAYANGVRTFGAQPIARPDEDFYSWLYTDQGRDYKGHTIGGKLINYGHAAAIEGGLGFLCGQRRVGLIDDLGLKQLMARGYNAREKPIERTHRDMSAWERSIFEAEYCGADAKSKPDAWKDAWARHERLVKKAHRTGNMPWLDESPFMTIDDYRDALAGYFFEYNHAVHERVTLGGAKVVPIEEHERLYTTRYEISETTLALLLMKVKSCKVEKNGVRMNGFSYLHPDLAYYKKQYVEVRYSEDDYTRCFVIPPPTNAIPNPQIIEAQAVIAGSILKPNKQSQAMVAQQRKHEEKIKREHSLLTHSIIRGESTEDRVVAQLEPEVEEVSQVALAVGSNATGSGFTPIPPARVHLVGRLDRRHVRSQTIRPVTVDQVKETQVDESIFEAPETASAGVKLWEDDDED
jgi:hypothetical protein